MRRIGEKGMGKFERISWQEALDAIGKNFRDVIEQHGAEVHFAIQLSWASGFVEWDALR